MMPKLWKRYCRCWRFAIYCLLCFGSEKPKWLIIWRDYETGLLLFTVWILVHWLLNHCLYLGPSNSNKISTCAKDILREYISLIFFVIHVIITLFKITSLQDFPRSNVLYGYRIDGPRRWHQGHRFDSSIVLIDPYAKLVEGRRYFGDASNKFSRFLGSYDFDSLPFDWGENYKLPNIHEVIKLLICLLCNARHMFLSWKIVISYGNSVSLTC